MKFIIVCMLIAVTLVYKNNGSMLTLEKANELINLLSDFPAKPDNVKNSNNCTGLVGYSFCSDDSENCDYTYYCQRGNPYPLASKCEYGSTCYKGKCSNSTLSDVCQYRNQKFRCVSSDGLYPEPSSCMRYNHCLPNVAVPIQSRCEHGWGYNPATASCDYSLSSYMCADYNRPIPKCLTLGQNAALKGNPALYYVCLPYDNKHPTVFYPFLYKCPRNSKYAGDYVCK